MSNTLKRFYKSAAATQEDGGWHVALDGRPVRTPGRALQTVPTQALAEAMAEEWNQQDEQVEIAAMHLTRLANVAIDRAPETRNELCDEVAKFCETDLTCHLAPNAPPLRRQQDEIWRPLRDWAGQELNIVLVPVEGIMASPQPAASLANAHAHATALDDFRLTGLVYGCGLFSSAVLALAVEQGKIDALEAFGHAQLEEDYQMEQWGTDTETVAIIAARRLEAAALGAWFETLGTDV